MTASKIPKRRVPVFVRGIAASVLCVAIAIFLLVKGDAPRSEFQKITGAVTYIGRLSPIEGQVDNPKTRYLIIDDSPPVFKLFIGMDPGDLSPVFQEIDSIKLGDRVDLYYDERLFVRKSAFNNLTYFIDRGDRNMFRKGSSDKAIAWVLISLFVVFIGALLFLKKRGKII